MVEVGLGLGNKDVLGMLEKVCSYDSLKGAQVCDGKQGAAHCSDSPIVRVLEWRRHDLPYSANNWLVLVAFAGWVG